LTEEKKYFPILKGESVGEPGEFNGYAIIVRTPDDLKREWSNNEIAVLQTDMEQYFNERPREIDHLFEKVSAVIAEFGESIGDFASFAQARDAICLVKTADASFVLEDKMHITISASENLGEIYFID
jgi:phosphohistidine swiveling domain-containing protein